MIYLLISFEFHFVRIPPLDARISPPRSKHNDEPVLNESMYKNNRPNDLQSDYSNRALLWKKIILSQRFLNRKDPQVFLQMNHYYPQSINLRAVA